MPAATTSHRYLRFTGMADGSQLRTAIYNGVSHIVVPVIAMVGNSIVRPLNSDGMEFVPASELSISPAAWNGRPVLPDHPDGGRSSANKPRTLELYKFGEMFDARFEDGKLKTNVYLDPSRADKVGHDAVRVIERCRAGEMVEVSVGAFITFESGPGSYNGQDYIGSWRDIRPDHLAMLPEGAQGACSVEMGCGAPRAAKSDSPDKLNKSNRSDKSAKSDHLNISRGFNTMKTTAATTAKPEKTVKQPSALARMYHSAISMLSSVRSAEGDTSGTSDSELRLALYEALRHTEPAFDNYYYGDGIFDVWQDTNTVVYCTCPDDEMLLWQQTYTMNADGSVTLNGDRQRVEYKPVPVAEVESLSGTKSAGGARHSSNDVKMIKTIHDTSVDLGAECESVAAASTALAVSATKSDCNCTSAARNAASRKDTTVDKDKFKPIVERLIRGAATEEDRVVLTTEFGFDAEMLKTAGATSKPDKSAVKPAPTRLVAASSHTPTDDDDADADDGEELTEEQWLASAPASLRAMHAKYQAEDTARRTSLLSTLAVAAKGIYTEAQLVSKPTDELEALAKLAKKDAKPVAASTPRNFAAQGVAVPPDASTSDEQFKRLNPPNGYEIALARAAGKEVKDIYTYGRENSSSTAKAPN